ncbi:hypothetical protein CAPTEDRAFT_148908, partial [Capitella teleta]
MDEGGSEETPSPPAITQQSSPPLPQMVVKPQPRSAASQPGPTQHVPIQVQEQEVTIRISRPPGMGLGISIAGGVGSTAYRGDDEGIFISRVTDDGPSGKAGLMVGDKLLSVNGNTLVDADHHRAVGVLKDAGNTLTMVVAREALKTTGSSSVPKSVQQSSSMEGEIKVETIATTLNRDTNGLGFSIAGGRGSTPFKGNEESIYISRVTDGGAAAIDGKIRVGDRLISINGVDVSDARHDQAVALLTSGTTDITLVVYREHLLETPEPVAPPPPPVTASMTAARNSFFQSQQPSSLVDQFNAFARANKRTMNNHDHAVEVP